MQAGMCCKRFAQRLLMSPAIGLEGPKKGALPAAISTAGAWNPDGSMPSPQRPKRNLCLTRRKRGGRALTAATCAAGGTGQDQSQVNPVDTIK